MRRFLKAVKNREHRIAASTWVGAAAAVLYAIWPFDLIPELILGPLGLTDDLAVWAIPLVLVGNEYRRWQSTVAVTTAATAGDEGR